MHKYADILVIPAWSKVCYADKSACPVERVKDCSTLYQPASRRCLGNSLSNIERPMSMVLAPSLTMTQSVTNARKKCNYWDNVTYFKGIQNTFSVQRNLEAQSIQYWVKTGKQFYLFHRGLHYTIRNVLLMFRHDFLLIQFITLRALSPDFSMCMVIGSTTVINKVQ